MGLGTQVFEGIGTMAGAGPKSWRPSKSYLKALQGYQASDMARLHSADPFGGPGLGFSDAEMMAKIGSGVDQAQTEYAANLGDIERQAAIAGPGGASASSGAYLRNRQRAAGGLLGRSALVRRENVIENAGQKRSDLYNRIGATGAERGYSTNLYNAVEQERAKKRMAPYSTAGGIADVALSAYGMGMGG
ncbi:MAG TPA: hypothetical protein VJV75_13325 [Candidatus Polarisedimenticolia bacterium]|nr:hypothetical protein [Candidatus Polarisedimenticolia bacterium]